MRHNLPLKNWPINRFPKQLHVYFQGESMAQPMLESAARLVRGVLFALFFAMLVSCGGGGGGSTPPAEIAQPVFTSQPASQTVALGTRVTFFATVASAAPVAYQWQRNGVDVAGATDSQYSFVVQESDNHSVWTVKANNGAPTSVISQAALLLVTSEPGISLLAGDRNAAWPSGEFEDGVGASARFFKLTALTVDRDGNVFVTDNETVRKITRDGVLSTVAGGIFAPGRLDGPGRSARFETTLRKISVDAHGNLYALDGPALRKIDRTGVVSTISMPGTLASGLAVDSLGNSYVSLVKSYSINAWAGSILKVSPDGNSARFSPEYEIGDYFNMTGAPIAIDAQDQVFSQSCLGPSFRLQTSRLDSQGNRTVVAESDNGCWKEIALDNAGTLYGANLVFSANAGQIARFVAPNTWVPIVGGASALLPGSLGAQVRGMAFGPDGLLYVIANNSVVRIKLP